MNTDNHRIAIIHDSFVHFGGAERVLLALISLFPNADIYTSLITKQFQDLLQSKSNGKIYYSRLSNVPLAIDFPSLFKPYFYHYYWRKLPLNNYDLVISSSHSCCANWVKVKGKHLSYIYTPPRFLYGVINEMRCLSRFPIRQLFVPYFNYLRHLDNEYVHKIDCLVTISENVRNRICAAYSLPSEVVYPPVTIPVLSENNDELGRNYYLFFSRLVKQKGAELVIKAFNQNHKPLVVVGEGKERARWERMAQRNIIFKGFVPDSGMNTIYRSAKSLIYTAIDEDFGMVPVEAMAHGVPVIAYRSGGVRETVIDRETGVFFDRYSVDSLNAAIKEFDTLRISASVCKKRAAAFSDKIFKQKMNKIVRELMS